MPGSRCAGRVGRFLPMSPLRSSVRARRRAAVFVGAAAGTGLRAAVGAGLAATGAGTPVPTLVVNVTGSFLLGLLVGRRSAGAGPGAVLVAFAGIGLLGAFTTFSAFSAETFAFLRQGRAGVALGYVVLSLVLGITAAVLGDGLGRRR